MLCVIVDPVVGVGHVSVDVAPRTKKFAAVHDPVDSTLFCCDAMKYAAVPVQCRT